ncbi:VanZ family protein [Amnibacterium endophyticum]|uniref:VanZ family protein n=1 Tax=Amnibacterium endophyticum TaxID=2109337 RepID=A0ABW4LDZ6_9MICO
MTTRLRLLPVALVGGAVLVLLLVPRHVDLHISWLSSSGLVGHAADGGTPLWWLLEDLSNIAMFVPVGWVAARLLRPGVALGAGVALSAACELAQLWIPNRHGSLRDVAMNAIGVAIGVAIVALLRRRQARRAAPQVAQDQNGRDALPATAMGVRQRPQFGVPSPSTSASDDSSLLTPTGTW